MTITERPNKQALTQGLDIYRDAMRPFIVEQLGQAATANKKTAVTRALHPDERQRLEQNLSRNKGRLEATIDVNHFSWIVANESNWDECFASVFGNIHRTRNQLISITDSRNLAAHPAPGDLDKFKVISTLTDIVEVLDSINAADAKSAVEKIRADLIQPADIPTSQPTPPPTVVPEPAPPTKTQQQTKKTKKRQHTKTGLKPWLDVIEPHDDILSGDITPASFAADLQEVVDGIATAKEYRDPIEFFRRTYLTPGLQTLLVNTLKRINGKPGDPVIQTKTGFGGGKTHSLIALYHLLNSTEKLADFTKQSQDRTAQELTQVFTDAEVPPDQAQSAKVAVLIGTYLSPTDDDKTVDGDPLNTLWGQMAYKLGRQEAYNIIGNAARQGISPGGAQLDRLFEHVGAAVVLFDELVAYVRTVPEEQIGSVYTFMQALSESARRNPNVALVVTLPESEDELGGDTGYQALNRLERVFGRIEAVHAPLETNEAFEVVRRRLFKDPKDKNSLEALEETCEKFFNLYRRNHREYPDHASKVGYQDRLRRCYPIHPEIFDRLYNDWSTIQGFQRTRGVLRLMALWIKRLYRHRTPDPLILPANLPLDDSTLSQEFVKHLHGRWEPVVSEIDGTNSRTDQLEKDRWLDAGGIAKRITRTIFLGSVPGKAIRGIDQEHIHLGVVQPTEGLSVYNEARNEITGKLYYLHNPNSRYFFHTEENLNKVHADRREAISNDDADRYIVKELNDAVRGNRSSLIVCPESSADIPEADTVRFIILHPDKHLITRASDLDTASQFIKDIILTRGDASRTQRNTLVFITAKADEIRALRNSTKSHRAWVSMLNGETKLDLSEERRDEVVAKINAARNEMIKDLVRAYRCVIVPIQRDPQQSQYALLTKTTRAAETGEIVKSAEERLVADDEIANAIATSQLNRFLKTYIWDNGNDHITVDSLWELFTTNVYFPRLRAKSVLEEAIQRGTQNGDFGYADRYEGEKYENLRFKESIGHTHTNDLLDSEILLVNPENAKIQKMLEAAEAANRQTGTGSDQKTKTKGEGEDEAPDDDPTTPKPKPGPSRITATKEIQGDISLDTVSEIRDEIIRNLTDDGGDVTVTITVSASKSGGFSPNTTRAVRENCTQLELRIEER